MDVKKNVVEPIIGMEGKNKNGSAFPVAIHSRAVGTLMLHHGGAEPYIEINTGACRLAKIPIKRSPGDFRRNPLARILFQAGSLLRAMFFDTYKYYVKVATNLLFPSYIAKKEYFCTSIR